MLKLQAIFRDGSVGMEFMTDNASETEEMREQMLAFDCVAEVRVLTSQGGSACNSRVLVLFRACTAEISAGSSRPHCMCRLPIPTLVLSLARKTAVGVVH